MISISGLRFAALQNFQLDSKPRITSISGFWLHPRGRLPNMTSISGFWPEHDQHQWVGVSLSCGIVNWPASSGASSAYQWVGASPLQNVQLTRLGLHQPKGQPSISSARLFFSHSLSLLMLMMLGSTVQKHLMLMILGWIPVCTRGKIGRCTVPRCKEAEHHQNQTDACSIRPRSTASH